MGGGGKEGGGEDHKIEYSDSGVLHREVRGL